MDRENVETVGVVVGIVVRRKQFLVERRSLDEKLDPGIVCLPAGHVKKNESLEVALKREMLEELGIHVNEMKFVCKNFHVASNGEKQHAYCYLISNYDGEPICKTAEEIFWEEDINNLSLEIDRKIIRKMRENQGNKEKYTNNILEKLKKIQKKPKDTNANAAVAVILRSNIQGLQVLLVKRAEKLSDPWSGQTALPGGKRNLKDHDLKQTVIRETIEETGIDLLKDCRFLGKMNSFRSTQKPEMQIVPFVFFQDEKQDIELNDELDEYFWVTLKEIQKNKGTMKFRKEEFPAFIIGNHIIWGLTLRILKYLLSIILDIEEKN
ncbi:NUDIX domain-containing protein [Candidatus Bathyarchaeota archaeon]|nr:NUDIX domain-containing protein [Candidatus Bathyarchaeota archaeon]